MLEAESKLKNPRQRELMDAKLRERTGKSAKEIHAEETSESTKKSLECYAEGDMEGGDAMRMIAASEAWLDDNEDGMSKGFEGMEPDRRARVAARMDKELKETGRGGLEEWRESELSDAQNSVTVDREKEGKISDVNAMVLAGDTTLGFGHDGASSRSCAPISRPPRWTRSARSSRA